MDWRDSGMTVPCSTTRDNLHCSPRRKAAVQSEARRNTDLLCKLNTFTWKNEKLMWISPPLFWIAPSGYGFPKHPPKVAIFDYIRDVLKSEHVRTSEQLGGQRWLKRAPVTAAVSQRALQIEAINLINWQLVIQFQYEYDWNMGMSENGVYPQL